MEATLTVIGGKTSKRTITLRKLPTVIGRGKSPAHHRPSHGQPPPPRVVREGRVADGPRSRVAQWNAVGGRRIKEVPLPPGGEFSIGPRAFAPIIIRRRPEVAAADRLGRAGRGRGCAGGGRNARLRGHQPYLAGAAKVAQPAKAAKKHDHEELLPSRNWGWTIPSASRRQDSRRLDRSKPGEKAAAQTLPPGRSSRPPSYSAAAKPPSGLRPRRGITGKKRRLRFQPDGWHAPQASTAWSAGAAASRGQTRISGQKAS